MGKASKDKGYRGENNLRNLLQDAGVECKRVPLSGGARDLQRRKELIVESDLIAACASLGNNFITIRPEAQQLIKKYRQVHPDLSGIVEYLDKALPDGWWKHRLDQTGRAQISVTFPSVMEKRR